LPLAIEVELNGALQGWLMEEFASQDLVRAARKPRRLRARNDHDEPANEFLVRRTASRSQWRF
jgi:hypothetical protein